MLSSQLLLKDRKLAGDEILELDRNQIYFDMKTALDATRWFLTHM
jgi:hypothetical protein